MSDTITLKWGTLKAWDLETPACLELLQKYADLGMTFGAMAQRDTPEQKELICQIIDAADLETVWLDWDGEQVSKEEAKRYVREYGVNP